ncbi:thiamine kinase-like enzyme [Prosthecobacter fusiformis]|uniref:Thiamine kinase-like enzyme n=1 Tax=Prosthecobacter fusiformis TaxID=48464 RepID=A0A4R7RN21_9BACT|nr:aminoglycoside phosphotransferase family protein [Prosthecobacter fusiformis]TDU66188.1 thiamine kinase-like enzyme [Prosthecobacter fusiformis]
MSHLTLPIRAATETAQAHGITPDRCDILQDGSTLVLRLTETLVARVVQDVDGPRQGTEWFARENAMALHLTQHGAPIIPLHPALPPGPHQHLGYPINYWLYVTAVPAPPEPKGVGRTLWQCHDLLRSFPAVLPKLAILTESLALLDTLAQRQLLPAATLDLLRRHLTESTAILDTFPHQPLHGDAHLGNLMNTTIGLLWTDWEDTFSGPVEWDLASVIWNARILEEDHETVNQILNAYLEAGGSYNEQALHQCLVARAAVMSAWYPILYPNPNAERKAKLQFRLDWLSAIDS